MRTIIRHLANACHSVLTLPIIAMLAKGGSLVSNHNLWEGGLWLAAGVASVYLWHFGGRWVLGYVAQKTTSAHA